MPKTLDTQSQFDLTCSDITVNTNWLMALIFNSFYTWCFCFQSTLVVFILISTFLYPASSHQHHLYPYPYPLPHPAPAPSQLSLPTQYHLPPPDHPLYAAPFPGQSSTPGLHQVHSNPSLLTPPTPSTSAPHPAPPLWPPPDQSLLSLANVLSLAMSVAQSFQIGNPNQGFLPQPLSPSFSTPISSPMSQTLGATLPPTNHNSFSVPFTPQKPYNPPTPHMGSVPESQQGAPTNQTAETFQVGIGWTYVGSQCIYLNFSNNDVLRIIRDVIWLL